MMQLASFVICVVVLLINSKAAAVGSSMVRSDCLEKCGKIDIPFPFGIGDNCYKSEMFEVTCNKTVNPHKALLRTFSTELLAIYLNTSTVRIKGPIHAFNCSDRRTNIALNLIGSPFTFSSENKLTAMGCDNRVLLNNVKPEIVGCKSTCNSTSFQGGACSGDNCCQTTIPTNLQLFDARSESSSDQWYEGNPYLPDGCADTNECEEPIFSSPCSGMTKCVNLPGSYKCELDKSKITGLVIGSVAGVLFFIAGIWKSYKLVKKRKNKELRKKFFKRNGGLLLQQQLHSSDGAIQKTKVFSSKELDTATDRFNQNRVLGQGGQGTVYKGMLSDGRIVAVKKSIMMDEEKVEELINEVVILSQVNHRNVVKLHGCCLETEVPLLVYEFIPNGNLFQYLHEQNEEFQFPWEMRLRIATEVAAAVSYLHSAASIPVYHRDIKTTNILLDERYGAKVSDFGASRSISIDQTHLTTHVQGTFGYLDPEYFQSSQLTEKSDVYSFGVVLVELISGQKPISFERSEERRSLATHFILVMEEGRLVDILDRRLMEECREGVIAVAKVARKCLNLNGRKRPTMKEVGMELERIRSSQELLSENENREELESMMNMGEERGHWDDVHSSMTSNFENPKALTIDIEPLIPLNTW